MHACLWRHQKYGTQDIKMPGMNHFVGKSVKMAKIDRLTMADATISASTGS